MALTAIEEDAWRRALADEAAAIETLAIISSGTAAALSTNANHVLRHALGLDRVHAGVVAAFESGAALGAEEQEAIRRMVGDTHGIGANVVTEIGAIA